MIRDGRKMTTIGFKELGILARRYGFKNILDFSVWVEDNNLAEALGLNDDDYIEEDLIEEKEDKDSLKYKSKVLALDILALPEAKEEFKKLKDQNKSTNSIAIEKWSEWGNLVRGNRKNKK